VPDLSADVSLAMRSKTRKLCAGSSRLRLLFLRDVASEKLTLWSAGEPLPSFCVIPEIRFACDDRMPLGVFDLFRSESEFFVVLTSTFFSGKRRRSAGAPVVFHGDEDQHRHPQKREQSDKYQYPSEARHRYLDVLTGRLCVGNRGHMWATKILPQINADSADSKLICFDLRNLRDLRLENTAHRPRSFPTPGARMATNFREPS
jgi:hypothetical protein